MPAESDPAVHDALENEARRQEVEIELIASENITSAAVREALGHEVGNKTLEGYPGARFHQRSGDGGAAEPLTVHPGRAVMHTLFARSPLFERMRPEAIRLLARSTVRRRGDGGGYQLRCPREYEAQVFEYFCVWSMTVDVGAVTCPVKVVGSDPTVRNSFMPSMDLGELAALDHDFVPETSHLLPLEEPEECAALTTDFLEQHDLPVRNER